MDAGRLQPVLHRAAAEPGARRAGSWRSGPPARQERALAAAPVLRALHVPSARLHDEYAAERGDDWRFHHTASCRCSRRPPGWRPPARRWSSRGPWACASTTSTEAEARRLFPGLRCAVAGAYFFPEDGHLDPMLFTRAVARMAAEAGAIVVTGAEVLALEPAPAGVRAVTTRGRVRGRPGGAGGRRLVSASSPAGWACACPSSRPRATASTSSARPDFPELPLYLGDAHVVLTPLGDSLRLGSTLELSGWDMRVRPRRVAYLRAGRRARHRRAGGRSRAAALARARGR